jgi:hypothetical protein
MRRSLSSSFLWKVLGCLAAPTGTANLMPSDWELWACAATVLQQHCVRAPTFVAERLGDLALAGDVGGVATWKAIAVKVHELSARGTVQCARCRAGEHPVSNKH